MYRKIWAILRYEMNKELKEMHKPSKEEVYGVYDKQMKTFESYRLETYRLVMDDANTDSRTARRNMLKAYITFAMDINNLVAK